MLVPKAVCYRMSYFPPTFVQQWKLLLARRCWVFVPLGMKFKVRQAIERNAQKS